MKNQILFLTLLTFSLNLSAEGFSSFKDVSYIEMLDGGTSIIESVEPFSNPDGCSNPKRLVILGDKTKSELFVKVALTGYASNSTLGAWVDGCWQTPWDTSISYPIVKNISIRK